jgi:hypothetical protein
MSKQTSLTAFGFKNNNQKMKMTVSIKEVKQRSARFVKGSFTRNGQPMNVLGTLERDIKIDGSNKEYREKAQRIVIWSRSRPKFDIGAITGILDYEQFRHNLTTSQRDAIDNIYYRCDVVSAF